MSTNNSAKPFTVSLIDAGSGVALEIRNETTRALKSVEILTVFLKDNETPGGGPSQAHIKFETLGCIQPGEKLILPHRTWLNGRPVNGENDQLERLRVVSGETSPYVLDISWTDIDGKTLYQRIPVGH